MTEQKQENYDNENSHINQEQNEPNLSEGIQCKINDSKEPGEDANQKAKWKQDSEESKSAFANSQNRRVKRVKKRKKNRYTRGKKLQYLIILSLIMVGTLVATKAQHIITKVSLVNEGLDFYSQRKWIEAEEKLQKTINYNWFNYKEEETQEVLESLNWVTEYYPFMEGLYQEIKTSSSSLDLEQFEAQVQRYDESGIHGLTDEQQHYLLAKYPVDQIIDQGFKAFYQLMVSKLTEPLQNNDYNWAKENIGHIPETYFDGDKEKIIIDLFTTCDTKLYTANEKITGVGTFEDLLELLNQIYTINRECKYDTNWLTEQVKVNIYTCLLDKSKGEMSIFAQYIKAYRTKANSGYQDQSVETLVETFMDKKSEEMQALLNSKQYEELLKLYKEMNYFKDYQQEIKQVENLQKYDNPELLLKKPAEEYDYLKQGMGEFEADKFIFGVNQNTQEIELQLLKGNPDAYEVKAYSYALNSQGISLEQIQNIELEDSLILIRLQGTNQKERVQVIALKDEKLEVIFEIEGDQILTSQSLKQITVTNPSGETILADYNYLFDGTVYVKEELAPLEINLGAANILDYKGKLVKFTCYVPETIKEETTKAYSFLGETYYEEDMVYIYWEDGSEIKKGTYTVVGELIDTKAYYSEAAQQEVLRPKVKILKLEES